MSLLEASLSPLTLWLSSSPPAPSDASSLRSCATLSLPVLSALGGFLDAGEASPPQLARACAATEAVVRAAQWAAPPCSSAAARRVCAALSVRACGVVQRVYDWPEAVRALPDAAYLQLSAALVLVADGAARGSADARSDALTASAAAAEELTQLADVCRALFGAARSMQAHNSVSPRFARNAHEESPTRRIIHRIQLNNRPVAALVAFHARKSIGERAALVNPDGVGGTDQAERHAEELIETQCGGTERQAERAHLVAPLLQCALCAPRDLYKCRKVSDACESDARCTLSVR